MAKATTNQLETAKKTKPNVNGGKNAIHQFADFQINTEQGQAEATQGLWNSLCLGSVEHDAAGLLLNTLGKVLTRESIKVKAGIYKMAGARRGFFLSA